MTTEREAQSRQAADDVYNRMRGLINIMADSPGEFNLSELARVALEAAGPEALERMALDILLHKGRQHCGGKIRRPDGEEGVVSDADRGPFPRAVPINQRGTSTWVGWWFSDDSQKDAAAHRRESQSRGLDNEADRIRLHIAEMAAHRRHRELDLPGDPPSLTAPVSVDRNAVEPVPPWELPERPWDPEGRDWLN